MGKVVFYTKEENRELKPFLERKLPVTKENLADFCKKYNRTFGAVGVHIYTTRKEMDKASSKAKKGGRTIVPYSEEEKQEMKSIIDSRKPINENNLKSFCKKYNRTFLSAQQSIYRMKKSLGTTRKHNPSEVASRIKQNEFAIPIINWEIRKVDDVVNLILKF